MANSYNNCKNYFLQSAELWIFKYTKKKNET